MEINVNKTKMMVIGTKLKRTNIPVGNHKILNVQATKYLASWISEDVK